MTTKLQHDNTVKSIVNSIEEVYAVGVFDDILLYNRKMECNPDKSIDNEQLICEMRSQVAQAQFTAELCENGFRPTDEVMACMNTLVQNTGRLWKLEEIAEAYKSGEEVDYEIKNIGRQLENQQIVRDMEIQPEL